MISWLRRLFGLDKKSTEAVVAKVENENSEHVLTLDEEELYEAYNIDVKARITEALKKEGLDKSFLVEGDSQPELVSIDMIPPKVDSGPANRSKKRTPIPVPKLVTPSIKTVSEKIGPKKKVNCGSKKKGTCNESCSCN